MNVTRFFVAISIGASSFNSTIIGCYLFGSAVSFISSDTDRFFFWTSLGIVFP
ncbi:hypothetical protein ACI2OX_19875 [Bacillus sp. N9]